MNFLPIFRQNVSWKIQSDFYILKLYSRSDSVCFSSNDIKRTAIKHYLPKKVNRSQTGLKFVFVFKLYENITTIHVANILDCHNHVNIIYSHYWKGFSKLQHLRLSWNNITYIEPESILLPNLQFIYLDHNHLVNIDLWMWMMLAFLNEIHIYMYAEHNEISIFH